MKKGTCRIIGEKNKDPHFLENVIDLRDYETKNETLKFLIFGNGNETKKYSNVKH